MNKSCDNCYWTPFGEKWCICNTSKPTENFCDEHDFSCSECDSDRAEYKYKDKYYCLDCLLKEFNVEEYTVTHYHIDGSSLGSDDDMTEVIENISKEIEILD